MYPTYEIALQRQAETRASAARRRMAREARSGSRARQARALPAWTQRLRPTAARFRPAQT